MSMGIIGLYGCLRVSVMGSYGCLLVFGCLWVFMGVHGYI